jgi:hypothetical protein
MNAELTTRALATQNGGVFVPDTSQPVSNNIPAARVTSGTFRLPAAIWCMLVAITSDMIGAYWDVAWHQSVGRDTFWTPAHLAIQLCGVLGGLTSGFLILSTTFGYSPAAYQRRAASVKIWGFRGPLGAFIAAWGGFAMITSAPFDNWWHNAYGLDVAILSPPHVLLMSGAIAIDIGTLILIGGAMNRSQGDHRYARLLPHHRIHGERGPAQCDCLSCGFIGSSSCTGGRGACLGTSLGKRHYCRHLHGCCLGPTVDSSTLCSSTETRAGLSKCDSLHSNGVSAVANSAWSRARPAVESYQRLGTMVTGCVDWNDVLGELCCLSVALRELPDITDVAESHFRNALLRVRRYCRIYVRSP